MAQKAKALPAPAKKRLKPYIDRGITNGIFTDSKPVADMYHRKAADPSLAATINDLGGPKAAPAQQFITETVLVDLSAILRQKKFNGHIEVWEIQHRIVGVATGNPRPLCAIFGQVIIDDDDMEMDPALFNMTLWDNDASLADDVERDGTYNIAVSCRNLDAEVLDLRAMQGIASFQNEDYDHSDRATLLNSMFDVVDIADLENDISSSMKDYRLIEATVSFAGIQNSRAGNQFGKMLLKDDSTMTMDAIESGENLLLNCITSTSIASRFGKYSRILALVTTKMNGEYGLSANLECALGLVVVKPPEPESVSGDDDSDDAADYFKTDSKVTTFTDDDDDDDDDEDSPTPKAEAPPAPVKEEPKETAPEPETVEEKSPEVVPETKAAEPETDGDDDWDDWD
jgi:hypothetical protein